MTFTRTGAHAPHEHPDDGRRVALIFAAAARGCGLSVCESCNAWIGLRADLGPGEVSRDICPVCADGKPQTLTSQPEFFYV